MNDLTARLCGPEYEKALDETVGSPAVAAAIRALHAQLAERSAEIGRYMMSNNLLAEQRTKMEQERNVAHKQIAALTADLDAARADVERLDWLEAQKKQYGSGWCCRNSTTGRGMRLHEHSGGLGETYPTVRAALDAARGKP